jgi:hypothetical protein
MTVKPPGFYDLCLLPVALNTLALGQVEQTPGPGKFQLSLTAES